MSPFPSNVRFLPPIPAVWRNLNDEIICCVRSRVDGHGCGAGARLQSRTEAHRIGCRREITKLEDEAIKAVLANDWSLFEKFLANDYTGGTSCGTWDTKPSILADMKDVKNNKTTSQNLTDLKVASTATSPLRPTAARTMR